MGRASHLAHVTLSLRPDQLKALQQQLAPLGVVAQAASSLESCLASSSFLLLGRPRRIDWSPAKRLRLLQIAGAGVDPLLPASGLSNDVFIAKTRTGHEGAVRDHALALLLAFARQLPSAHDAQRSAQWRPTPLPALEGKHLAVLGLGEVGTRVGLAAHHLGLRVTGVCRRPRQVSGVQQVRSLQQLPEVLRASDFVVICLPLTSHTRGLIDAAALELLPAHAVLINVARGAIVDEAALEARLRAGKLGGAALDAFSTEPLPQSSSLWSCPRLLITPHQAGHTPDYLERVCQSFVENVQRVLQGQRPSDLVSRVHEY